MATKKKSKLKYWVIGGVLLLIISIVIAEKMGSKEGTKVSSEKVMKRDIIETVTANGKIQPETELKISPDVSGQIVEMRVKEGDSVIKGQALCNINQDMYTVDVDRQKAAYQNTLASVESARARLKQSEARTESETANFNRMKKLFDQKVISQAEWEAARSTYLTAISQVEADKQSINAMEYTVKSSEAGVRESQKRLSRTTIYAPKSGTISKLYKKQGESVVGTNQMMGTDILSIADLNYMQVSVDINENDIVKIKKGDTAIFYIDAFKGRKFKGLVTEIGTSSNTAITTTDQVTNFPVKIKVLRDSYLDLCTTETPYPLKPGLSVNVDIQTNRVKLVWSVPIEAVATRELKKEDEKTTEKDKKKDKNKKSEQEESNTDNVANTEVKQDVEEIVFIIENGVVKKKVVKSGIQDDNYIQIEGMTGNEEIVTGPYEAVSKTLKDGDKVKVVKKEDLFEVKKK